MDFPFSYTLIPAKRKTIAIHITPTGQVEVRYPRRMPKREATEFLRSREKWVLAHLPGCIPDALTGEELRQLACQAAEWFPERVAVFAPQVGVTYGRITIRSQKTRWGSCSAKGNLNFNCLLMLAPEEVRDYVVIHELCHRKHMNHSPAFWQAVAKIMPDFAKRRAWLKEHGNELIARLPRENQKEGS